MSNNYFLQLWKADKLLCIGIICFCILSILLMPIKNSPFSSVKIPPFFTWDMYSAPYNNDNHFYFYEMKYNNKSLNISPFWDHNKMFFTFTIPNYHQYLVSDYKDGTLGDFKYKFKRFHLNENNAYKLINSEAQIKKYPEWLKLYFSNNLGTPILSLQVLYHTVNFNALGKIYITQTDTLINTK